MRFTKTFIPTVKEVPADAEIASHQLMIRAGLMRKLASGTYTYLPAGWRILQKIMDIVRDEMNKAGALEISMPMVQPLELWQKTGRDVDYGETLGRFTDRHGRGNVLMPTAEEVVTCLAAGEINSYKQLPINLYQINAKYRDEFRPRFGVLRSREFIMKDAYSFDVDDESLDKSYRIMYGAYCRIFRRCGLEYVIVEAETGEIGGSGSHQFTVPCDNGEDVIVYTEDGSGAWNLEKAPVDPAPKQQAPKNVPDTEEVHTPNVGSIEAVCDFLKCKPQDMIKTLIYSAGPDTIVAVIRGDHDLNTEKLTGAVGGKHIELADEPTIEKVTAAAVGFAGPMGLTEKVNLVLIDPAVAAMAVGITGANKTDYHVKNVVPGRDFALEGKNIKVVDIRNAVEGDTHDGKPLLFRRGIEVGQVFKLGTKYSDKLDAKFLDAEGNEKPCLMGCYGIGINRILASAIEISHDDKGPILPITIAPWEVIITPAGTGTEITDAAENIYTQLAEKEIEVLLDDRPDIRAGVKFNDADLLGIPVRVTVGQKSLAAGNVEIKLRSESESRKVALASAADEVIATVNSLKAVLNVGN
ncbi:MAG: proline--tRNA ligase [Planctomycetota bacterium]|nr:MAG: proline--tRNA ligase [Planctomycetota bacterium]